MTPQPLDYSPQKRHSPIRLTTGKVVLLCVLLIALIAFHRGGFLTSADIRLDSGDLRYRYFGIPLVYDRMPEPERTQLLALAAQSKVLRPQWRQCATFPLPTSNHTDDMCRGWYFWASAWTAQDPQLARLMLEDVANFIKTIETNDGLPVSLSALDVVEEGNVPSRWVVKQGWRQDEAVLTYARSKGYNLPTTAPSR